MLFRMAMNWLSVISLALALVGCSDFLKGRKDEPEVLNFSNERLSCLKDLPKQLKGFSGGDASESEIRDSMNCTRDALLYFKNKTYGSIENAYTIDEMRNFFAKYFLKENQVTPEFAADLMKIKRILIGGNETYLTKEEIVRLVDLLAIVRDEAVQLAPHMKILMNQHNLIGSAKGSDWDKVSAATEQLRFSLQRLLNKIQLTTSDYTFDDAKRALSGLSDFLRGSDANSPYESIKEWVPLGESIKNVLMGSHAQLSQTYQWRESLDTLIDLYGLYLKYLYVIRYLNYDDMNSVRQLSQFVNQSLDLLENCQQMKSTGFIPVEDLDELIDQVLPYTKYKNSIRSSSLKKTYRLFILRVLSPDRLGDTRGFLGLDRKNMAAIRREFNIWRMDQSFVDLLKMNEETQEISERDLLDSYQKFNSTYVIEKGITSDPVEQAALKLSWLDFGDLLKSRVLVKFNKKGRIVEATNPSSYPVTWKSLTKMNLMRALARMLMLGYADNTRGRLSEALLSQAGLIAWYDEFNSFGLDIKAFDPRSGNSGSRSFLEANFFTFSGNGDNSMDQRETFEFISFLFSAGLSTSDDIAKDMKSCEISTQDVFGYPYLREECFQKRLRQNAAYYFDNMPEMVRYIQQLNDADYQVFYSYLKSASVTSDQKADLIETANIRTMVMILHYVESIMMTYDADKNQTLSLDEVYAAAPRFISFFRTVSPTKYDFLIKEGFAYLVLKGSMPGATDLLQFQVSKHFSQEATRKDILRLFGTLKEQLNKK